LWEDDRHVDDRNGRPQTDGVLAAGLLLAEGETMTMIRSLAPCRLPWAAGATGWNRAGRSRAARRRTWAVETLEGRLLLAAWVEQGPGPILNGDVEGMAAQHGSVAGAVEALAPEPGNPDVLYAGTVNGGIWKTTDAMASAPTWVPLTDHMPSLSISDLAFSP